MKTPMAQDLEVFLEWELALVRSKMQEATQGEASELWGQMKQLQKVKTWLHWWEGQTRKR